MCCGMHVDGGQLVGVSYLYHVIVSVQWVHDAKAHTYVQVRSHVLGVASLPPCRSQGQIQVLRLDGKFH